MAAEPQQLSPLQAGIAIGADVSSSAIAGTSLASVGILNPVAPGTDAITAADLDSLRLLSHGPIEIDIVRTTLEHGVPGGDVGTIVLPYNASIGVPTNQQMTQVADGLGSFVGFAHAIVTAIDNGEEGPATASASNAVSGTDSSRVEWDQVVGVDSYRIYFFDGSSFDPHSGWGDSTKARFVTHDNSTFDGGAQDFGVTLHGYTQGTDYREILPQMRAPTITEVEEEEPPPSEESAVVLMLAP